MFGTVFSFFSPAPEDERVAAFEPDDPLSFLCFSDENSVDLILRDRVMSWLFAHLDDVRRLRELGEHLSRAEPVCDDDVGARQEETAAYCDEPCISRTAAHECHGPGGLSFRLWGSRANGSGRNLPGFEGSLDVSRSRCRSSWVPTGVDSYCHAIPPCDGADVGATRGVSTFHAESLPPFRFLSHEILRVWGGCMCEDEPGRIDIRRPDTSRGPGEISALGRKANRFIGLGGDHVNRGPFC